MKSNYGEMFGSFDTGGFIDDVFVVSDADHNKLINKDKPDQHSIGSITGLSEELDAIHEELDRRPSLLMNTTVTPGNLMVLDASNHLVDSGSCCDDFICKFNNSDGSCTGDVVLVAEDGSLMSRPLVEITGNVVAGPDSLGIVKGTSEMNSISVAEDGSMTINSISLDKISTSHEDTIIAGNSYR